MIGSVQSGWINTLNKFRRSTGVMMASTAEPDDKIFPPTEEEVFEVYVDKKRLMSIEKE